MSEKNNRKYFDADHLPEVKPTPTGDGKNPHYALDPLTDEVVLVGYDDLDAMIQACESSCRLEDVLRRFNQTGDPALLHQRQVMYGDLRMPEDLAMQMLIKSNAIRQAYDTLDPDIREKVGTFKEFLERVSAGPKKIEPILEEAKPNE